jgi:hypothetical protein
MQIGTSTSRNLDYSIQRKRQLQQNDKMKKSSSKKDTAKDPEKDRTNSSNMPNQYARNKNTANAEEELQDSTEQDYEFIDEFLEEAVNTSNIYESHQETDYDYWASEHNIHTSISINNTLYYKIDPENSAIKFSK